MYVGPRKVEISADHLFEDGRVPAPGKLHEWLRAMKEGKAEIDMHVPKTPDMMEPGPRVDKLDQWDVRSSILFVGNMTDGPVGPHPIAQFEVHFRERSLATVVAAIEASDLRALVHPLTDDDVADHTSLARWIGEPIEIDVSVLDPPGVNQGVARFGKSHF